MHSGSFNSLRWFIEVPDIHGLSLETAAESMFWLFRVKRGEWISTWKRADWTLDTAGALWCLHTFPHVLPVPMLPTRQRPRVMSPCHQGNCTVCSQSSSHGSHLPKATSHLALLPLKGGRLKRLFILGWSRTGLRDSWTWQLILKKEDTGHYSPTLQGSDEWYAPALEQLSLCHFSVFHHWQHPFCF